MVVAILLASAVLLISRAKNQPTPTDHLASINDEELSSAEYEQIKQELLALSASTTPKVALASLRSRTATHNGLLKLCHPVVHELGRAAYEQYGDFGKAMTYQDELCNSGYLHGIIEAHFSKSTDILETIQSVCAHYPDGSYIAWECYHGVGHGVMYATQNDLPQSLALCEGYATAFSRNSCINGVFMENFNTDEKLHPSIYLDAADPFYPCASQAPLHRADCYVYAPTYYLSIHKNSYTEALAWCSEAPLSYRAPCAQGVGSQTMKENINNPKFAESVCANDIYGRTDECIMGMVSLFINHHGSIEPARHLCIQLEPSRKQACETAIKRSQHLFIES